MISPIPNTAPSAVGTYFYFLLPYIEQDNIYKGTQGQSSNAQNQVVPTFLAPGDFTLPGSNILQDKTGTLNLGAIGYAVNCWVVSGDSQASLTASAGTIHDDHLHLSVASIPKTFTDGTSTTILFLEKYAQCVRSGAPGMHTWANDAEFIAAPNTGGSGYDSSFTPLHQHAYPPEYGLTQATANCSYPQGFTTSGIAVGLADGSVRLVSPSISETTWRQGLFPRDGQPMGADWQ